MAQTEASYFDQINMAENWLEYDRKISQRRTLLFEYDRKIFTTTNIIFWIWPKLMTPTNSIFEFCLRRVLTPHSQLDYITRRDIPSRYYTSSFFGLMVKFGPSVSAVWSKIFGRLVKTFRPSGQNFLANRFYLFCCLDSALWTLLNFRS